MKNINSLSLKMIEALDKLVSSTKGEDGKIQFASRDLHLSDRDAAHHVTHVLSDEALAVGMIGFPPDLDRMLDRAIQKHIDDYNHPKI